MRVLMIANYFPPYGYVGGAEVANYHTCRALLSRGVDCRFLAVNNRLPEAFVRRYSVDGIPVSWVSLRTPRRRALTDIFDSRAYATVRRELRCVRPDVVHIHNVSGATLAPYLASRAARVPIVNTLHDLWLLCPNDMLYRPGGAYCDPGVSPHNCRQCFTRYDYWGDVPRRRALLAALTSGVARFVSPSQAYIGQHVRAGYAEQRFRHIPYGLLRLENLRAQHPAIREIVATAPHYHTLVFAAGGYEHKGAAVLLAAVPALLRHLDRLRIVIAGSGDGPLLDAFRRHAPRVQVLGKVPFSDMRTLFASADLSVVPSLWFDNSPVVIYENLQVGTPVLGSQSGGIPELICTGQTGYVFPVGDAAALAEKAIQHFARPSHERRAMRQRCVEESQTRLSVDAHAEAVLATYQEVLER